MSLVAAIAIHGNIKVNSLNITGTKAYKFKG